MSTTSNSTVAAATAAFEADCIAAVTRLRKIAAAYDPPSCDADEQAAWRRRCLPDLAMLRFFVFAEYLMQFDLGESNYPYFYFRSTLPYRSESLTEFNGQMRLIGCIQPCVKSVTRAFTQPLDDWNELEVSCAEEVQSFLDFLASLRIEPANTLKFNEAEKLLRVLDNDNAYQSVSGYDSDDSPTHMQIAVHNAHERMRVLLPIVRQHLISNRMPPAAAALLRGMRDIQKISDKFLTQDD
jgi:hypothetical protein